MKAPVEPNQEDCCNNGCSPCIFDVYEEQLKLYERYKNGKGVSVTQLNNCIQQHKYTSFHVTEVTDICYLHKMIKFRNKRNSGQVYWKPGQHFFVLFKTESKKCSRAYTPIKVVNTELEDFDFAIIVKQYCNGLISNYLFNLKKGDSVLWRGPYGKYEIIPNKFNNIIMIAQGTGILPFISIVQTIINNEDDMTKITLYYCCQSSETIILRDVFYSLKSFWNFSYKIYVRTTNVEFETKYQEAIIQRKLNFKDIVLSKESQYLLCGTDNFIDHYKSLLLLHEISSEKIVTF